MKEITFADIQKANETVNPIKLEKKNKKTGKLEVKEYTEVNQRIKAFRMLFPMGYIITRLLSNNEGICVFQAEVGFINDKGERQILGTGTAYEKEGSTFINQSSYIENCETSAVGRALAFGLGIGIDTSIASAEEVGNAILNQIPKELPKTKKGGYMDDAKLQELLELADSIGWDDKTLISNVRKRFGKNVTELDVDEYTQVVNGLCGVITNGKADNKQA